MAMSEAKPQLRIFEPAKDDILISPWEPTQDAGANLVGLKLEDIPLAGPRSPNPAIDRYLAKRRRENIFRAQREQVKELIEAPRRLYPPWWLRLRRTITHKRICLTWTE